MIDAHPITTRTDYPMNIGGKIIYWIMPAAEHHAFAPWCEHDGACACHPWQACACRYDHAYMERHFVRPIVAGEQSIGEMLACYHRREQVLVAKGKERSQEKEKEQVDARHQ